MRLADMTSRLQALSAPAAVAFAAFTLYGSLTMVVLAQSVTVTRTGNAITIRAPGLGFIKGEPLARLKDGQAVRVDLELDVLPGPGGAVAAQGRQTFILSYDLWEERFAVRQVSAPSRSISYLTSAGAEAWCLEQLTVPVSALGKLGGELPFWVRLGYRVLAAESAGAADGSGDFSLRGLIDTLSRRRKLDALTHSVEAGPFRLSQ